MTQQTPSGTASNEPANCEVCKHHHHLGIKCTVYVSTGFGPRQCECVGEPFDVDAEYGKAMLTEGSSSPFNLDDYRVPPAVELPTDLDPETRALAEANEQRGMVIAGLRNLAQMLADHPELPVPYSVNMQAGPSSSIKDWDVKRQYVINAAEALGMPLDIDTATTTTVRITLHSSLLPMVEYSVHTSRPADGNTPDPTEGQWRAANDGAGRLRWFLVRETPGERAEYHGGTDGRLVRYGSHEAAQREAARLNAAQLTAPASGDVASGLVPLRLTGGWNSSSSAALDIIRRQDDEGGVA